jgi:hypothetical protein
MEIAHTRNAAASDPGIARRHAGGMRRRLVLIVGFALMVAGAAPVATAGVAPVPDRTWMVDGPRVQDIVATETLVFVGGHFTEAIPPIGGPGVPAHGLVAFDAVTSEPVWTQEVGLGSSADAMVWDLELAADGTILYVCGSFDMVGSSSRNNVAALDPMTGDVLPWAPGGISQCRSLTAVGQDVVVGGGSSIRAVARDGSTRWVERTDGPVLTMTSDGASLYVGGRFSRLGDEAAPSIGRLDPVSGTVDAAWQVATVPFTTGGEGPFAIDLLVDRGSLFVAAGGADYAARYDLASGALQWWTDTSGSVQAIERVSWGTVVLGGHFQWVADADTPECGTNADPVTTCSARLRLASVSARTGALREWDPAVTGAYTGVWSLDLDPAGRLHVGGEFTAIGAQEHRSYGRFAAH